MIRIARFTTGPEANRGGISRMDWLERERRSVWPTVGYYVGIGLCWLLAVAGLLATVLLVGYVGAIGARLGWGV